MGVGAIGGERRLGTRERVLGASADRDGSRGAPCARDGRAEEARRAALPRRGRQSGLGDVARDIAVAVVQIIVHHDGHLAPAQVRDD